MAVRFVIGRAGSGKTRFCLDRARAEAAAKGLNARVFLVLPPQATFMAERTLCCGASAGDPAALPGAVAGVQVVSLESLVRELAGTDTRLAVSSSGRRLVLASLLRRHAGNLRHFQRSAGQAHLAAKIDAALTDLESSGLSIEEIAVRLEASGQGAAASDKLHDLQLLSQAWEQFLGSERVDLPRRLSEAAGRLRSHPALKGAVVLIDGYLSFTAPQRELIAAIAAAADVHICLLMDPGSAVLSDNRSLPGLGIFHKPELAYLKLCERLSKDGTRIERPLLLNGMYRAGGSEAMQLLERHWFSGRSLAPLPTQDVAVMSADSPRREVEAAARLIRRWQQEGVRLRDIGVLARQLDDYRAWIEPVFGEHGIACFLDRRRPMAHHALLRFVRSLLAILRGRWRQEHVLELLGSGLLPLSSDECDRLENFALAHGIQHKHWVQDAPWRFTSRPVAEGEEIDAALRSEIEESAACDELRCRAFGPILQFTRQLGGEPHTARVLSQALYLLLAGEGLKLRQRLSSWISHATESGELALAAEHQQAWTQLMAVLQELVDLLGDEVMSAADVAASLDAAMDGFDLAITPPTLDQVLVGQIDRSRSPEFRRVILLGLSDGIFPTRPSEDIIFSDAEKEAMLKQGIDLGEDSLRQILHERLLGYIAVTRASEKLVLSRHGNDESGAELPPSPFLLEITRHLQPLQLSPAEELASLHGIAEAVGDALAGPQTQTPSPRVSLLAQWLLQQAHPVAAATAAGLAHQNSATLSAETVSKLFTGELHGSVSRLEAYAACPFRHFAQSTLHLRKREVAELERFDLGNAFHAVLERLVRKLVRDRLKWDSPDLETALPRIVQEVGETLRGQLMLSSQRNRYLLGHIERTARQILDEQRFMQQSGCRLSPADVEVSFGAAGSPVPALTLSTPADRQLILHGRIDRVDVLEDQASAAIFDYKLRGKSLQLGEVYHGLSLQLLTYMLVLREHGAGRRPLTPVAAFYVELLRKLPRAATEEEATTPAEELDPKPRGIIHAEAAEQLGAGRKSPILSASYSKDGPRYDCGDLASEEHLRLLLDHVQALLAHMADNIMEGDIRIRPYMLARKTPCSWCDYRSICRFEPCVAGYNVLEPMGRRKVLQTLCGEAVEA
jgi:ATP-dependent helicase/nuclease subunit B